MWWWPILRWVFLNVLLPGLGLVPATIFALREDVTPDSSAVMTYAGTASGGNTLLWLAVIGLAINAFFNSKVPQVESLKAKLLAWIAARLAAMAAKIKPEGV